MRPAFLSATHGPRSKVNLQLGWGERDESDMLLIALAITKRDKYHLLILGDLAYLCSAVTGLPKTLGALDNRQQRISHNDRSALAAGTGAPAPFRPFDGQLAD